LLAHKSPPSLLRRIDRLLVSLPGATAFAFRLELLARLRSTFLQRWTVDPLEVPATLFRSDEWSVDAPDHGWGSLCKQMLVLPVRGGHRSLLNPEFRDGLCARFLQAVEMAMAGRQRPMSRTGS